MPPARLPLLSTYLGHVDPKSTYWYLQATPELLALAASRLENTTVPRVSTLPPLLQSFFTDRLIRQRQASPHTIAAYRDTIKLLLGFAARTLGKQPADLDLTDLDAPMIGTFLTHLENHRGNSVSTRNARLAAIRGLFRHAALHAPEHAALIERVLAIPPKRSDRAIVGYLTSGQTTALLAVPDRTTVLGRRDHALLVLAAQTGLRVSELTGLKIQDLHLGAGPHVRCQGEGTEEPHHPTDHSNRCGAAGLAQRTKRRCRAATVHQQERRCAQPGRRRTTRGQTRRAPAHP